MWIFTLCFVGIYTQKSTCSPKTCSPKTVFPNFFYGIVPRFSKKITEFLPTSLMHCEIDLDDTKSVYDELLTEGPVFYTWSTANEF